MTPDKQISEIPLWRKLAAMGDRLPSGWHPVRSPALQYDPPPEPTALGEAETVEEGGFALHDVGEPEPSGFGYFLDGIEMTRVSAYVDLVPIVHGYVAAVIRQRVDRSFRTWAVEEQEVLAFPFDRLDPSRLVDAGIPKKSLVNSDPESEESHPLRLAELGRVAVKKRRSALEAVLARRWADESPRGGWLLVDGGLAIEPRTLNTGRAVGLVKSHRTQFLDSSAMSEVLAMEQGQRSAVFKPVRPEIGEVYSWYLRLRSPRHHDIYWALARLEGVSDDRTLEAADRISRWLLSETAPLALPDPRWHVLLYPIRDCESYLRARMPTLAIA